MVDKLNEFTTNMEENLPSSCHMQNNLAFTDTLEDANRLGVAHPLHW